MTIITARDFYVSDSEGPRDPLLDDLRRSAAWHKKKGRPRVAALLRKAIVRIEDAEE